MAAVRKLKRGRPSQSHPLQVHPHRCLNFPREGRPLGSLGIAGGGHQGASVAIRTALPAPQDAMTVVVVAPLRVAGEMAVLRIRPAATLPGRRASGQRDRQRCSAPRRARGAAAPRWCATPSYAGLVHGLVSRAADGSRVGFVHLPGPFRSVDVAWAAAGDVIESAAGNASFDVVGEFGRTADGPASRSFQNLHIDFGVPLIATRAADVARFTAVHVAADARLTQASTRLVARAAAGPAPLARSRPADRPLRCLWPHPRAWDGAAGYTEGSLARIIEAEIGDLPVLASVKTTPGFRCGLEFTSLSEEIAFLAHRGVALDGIEQEVHADPGGVVDLR